MRINCIRSNKRYETMRINGNNYMGIRTNPVAQTVKHLPEIQETWVLSWSWEDSRRMEWLPTPVFLPGEFHGQRSLVGYPMGSQGVRHD